MKLLLFARLCFGLLLTLLSCLCSLSVCGQQKDSPTLKRSFRGVWIATINNIDWPSRAGLPAEAQKAEFEALLNAHQQDGMNAVIVQVRAAADAFYPSTLEPWSQWLTGEQGKVPEPYYDPLAFMIEAAHARNMEFHAWLNPFRAVANINTSSIHEKHISQRHPEWILNYGILGLFNPGIPEVRDYLTQVIVDLVARYPVDAIHFDDYFYPYPDPQYKLSDDWTFRKYGSGFRYKSDWRRSNMDRFIEQVSRAIKATNPRVKFGISPFSVWRNKRNSADGSNTRSGYTSYDHLHADVRHWLKEGWIDYVAPQLYQNIQHRKIPFKEVVKWWSNNHFHRHLYIGHAIFRLYWSSDKSWYSTREVPQQLRFTAEFPEDVAGNVYYSSNALTKNRGHIRDSLRQHFYTEPAWIPPMPWIDDTPPLPPQKPVVDRAPGGVTVSWLPPEPAEDAERPSYYAIFKKNLNDSLQQVEWTFCAQVRASESLQWVDNEAVQPNDYAYQIFAFDQLHNASKPVAAKVHYPVHPLITQFNIDPKLVRQLSEMAILSVEDYVSQAYRSVPDSAREAIQPVSPIPAEER